MKPYQLLIPCCLATNLSYASCGSAFCTVNTNWDTQGLSNDAGVLADLRYSYARADQWRARNGRKATEVPSGSDEEIENKRTINQLANLNLDYALDRHWGVILGVPFVVRDHAHTLDSSVAGPTAQQAKFSELGDIRLQGRYKFELGGEHSGAGLRFGVKLPTGATDKTMSPARPG